MKKYKFGILGHNYDVEINDFEDSVAHITVNGVDFEVNIESNVPQKQQSKTPILARKTVSTAVESEVKKESSTGLSKVTAPLPGSITKINVAVGDSIKSGDCLMVMEAMKMENNISAEKGGVVKNIKVKVGDTVLQGDTLIEIA